MGADLAALPDDIEALKAALVAERARAFESAAAAARAELSSNAALMPLFRRLEAHVLAAARLHGDDSVLQKRTERMVHMT